MIQEFTHFGLILHSCHYIQLCAKTRPFHNTTQCCLSQLVTKTQVHIQSNNVGFLHVLSRICFRRRFKLRIKGLEDAMCVALLTDVHNILSSLFMSRKVTQHNTNDHKMKTTPQNDLKKTLRVYATIL